MQNYEFAPNRDYLLRVRLWPFAKSGDRGVVVLSGDFWLVSEEFDGAKIRATAGKGGLSR